MASDEFVMECYARSTRIALLLSAAILVAFPLAVSAQTRYEDEAALERALAESADEPAEHEALAEHFRAKASGARQKADGHRWMSEHYSGSLEPAIAAQQKRHCTQLARLYDAQAKLFEELAQAHQSAAATP